MHDRLDCVYNFVYDITGIYLMLTYFKHLILLNILYKIKM